MKKYALVTGSTSGIGLKVAEQLAKRGYNLVINGRNEEKLKQIKENYKNTDTDVVDIALDLSLSDSALKLYNLVNEKNINIEVLVNNAGFGIFGELINADSKKIQSLINLNITTLVELSRLFGKQMKETGKGYILNIASTAAYQPVPLFSVYAASKSFVLHFSEALAKELEDFGVVVTCLSPGATDTGFFTVAGMGEAKNSVFAKKNRMSSETVAKYGINSLFKHKLSVIPGFQNKFIAFLNRFAPRIIVASLSKFLVYKAYKQGE